MDPRGRHTGAAHHERGHRSGAVRKPAPGVPDDAHAELVVLARDHGLLTIVDADETSLWQAVAAHPDVVKPSLTELYHGSLAPIALATKAVADLSSASCVLHLDHAEREDLVAEAVALGFRSVMFDGSKLDDDSNRRAARSVVERCHEAGVGVAAQLGGIGGKDGVHARGAGPILIMPCGSSLTPGSTPSRWPSVPTP